MFNVKVFKLKDLIKYFIELITVVSIIFATTKIVANIKKDEKSVENKKEGLINLDLTSCIAQTSELIKETNEQDSEIKAYKSNFFEDVLLSGEHPSKNLLNSSLMSFTNSSSTSILLSSSSSIFNSIISV